MVAGIVCCRTGRSRPAAAADPRRPARRCRRSGGDRVRRWPPAISIASGRPSTDRQIASTSSTWSVQLEARVDRGRDLLEQGHRVGEAGRAGPALDGEGVYLVHPFTGDAQARPAGHEHPEAGRPPDHLAHDVRGVDDVLEVVEHDQQGLPAQRLLQHLEDVLVLSGTDAELTHRQLRNQSRVAAPS